MNWLIPHVPPLSLLTFPASECTKQCLGSQIGWYIGTTIYIAGQFLPVLLIIAASYAFVRGYRTRMARIHGGDR